MIRWLQQRITWPVVLGLLLLQIVVSAILFTTGWVPQIEALSGVGLLDNQFAYSQDDIHRTLGLYGAEGRDLYRRYLLMADYLYGALSGLAFAAFFLRLSRLPLRWAPHLALLIWLPILMILFDYIENTLLLIILATYPDIQVAFISLASLATTLKLILVNVTFLLLLLGIVLALVVLIGQRRKAG